MTTFLHEQKLFIIFFTLSIVCEVCNLITSNSNHIYPNSCFKALFRGWIIFQFCYVCSRFLDIRRYWLSISCRVRSEYEQLFKAYSRRIKWRTELSQFIIINDYLFIHSWFLSFHSLSPHSHVTVAFHYILNLDHLCSIHSGFFPGFLHLFHVSFCLLILILYSSFSFHISRVVVNLISFSISSTYFFVTCTFDYICSETTLLLLLWSAVYLTGCQARWMITGLLGLYSINFLPYITTFVNI